MANHEWNIPNTTDTKFMIGSVSKPLTAMLMLIQVQKGLIELGKTISDYLPEYSKKNGNHHPSTLKPYINWYLSQAQTIIIVAGATSLLAT